MGTHHRIADRIRQTLDALDDRLSRLGRFGSTAALTAMAVAAALPLHAAVRIAEGLAVQGGAIVNLACEVAAIAAPIIFYARDTIDQLKKSRTHLDIMSRRLAATVEQAQAASKAKSDFLASMSHELRTPLNAILGFSEMMTGEHLGPMHNPRYLTYAADIHSSGRHLLGIINDILDLSKIEAGKMTLENAAEFPLSRALDCALGMAGSLAGKYGVLVENGLAQDGTRLVAVERMVCQILVNMLANAIKFTPAGGRVSIGGGTQADGGYALTVQDTGIGMTGDELREALMPFGQVANKMTAKHTGTGLGLPLAKAMMELHGGELTVESVPHHGTTVILRFPPSRVARGGGQAAAA